jgi:hypothetical protein
VPSGFDKLKKIWSGCLVQFELMMKMIADGADSYVQSWSYVTAFLLNWFWNLN